MEQPSWPAAYAAGLRAGYALRCREEAQEWREESADRIRVYVPGVDNVNHGWFYERPTAAERHEERMAIIREAHLAGLHGHRPYGCPWCRET